MGFELESRRGTYVDIDEYLRTSGSSLLSATDESYLEAFDIVYRSLCAALYNYAPMSGHPGGSISSGRIVASLLFETMDYDLGSPNRKDADMISYAAGHKALGLYALWALRDECAHLEATDLLPEKVSQRLRFEDLLGFRRNPITSTPLFKKLASKALDGHPTPTTPFVHLATGASGVGVASSLGLAYAAHDYFGPDAPTVHIIEGEGGLTTGRAAESLAAAATASLDNVVMHLDWNQASIDSNRVCRDGNNPGDYVQWNPMELFMLHDWNVIMVPEGRDFRQIVAAQLLSKAMVSTQPTAIVYKTVKGWRYGIEGKASHGAGHKLCSDEFLQVMTPLLGEDTGKLPCCTDRDNLSCTGPDGDAVREHCFWDALTLLRQDMATRKPMVRYLAGRLRKSVSRLEKHNRLPREGVPLLRDVYAITKSGDETPEELSIKPGSKATLRAELGKAMGHLNTKSRGAFLISAADLLGSTSIDQTAKGFPGGYYNANTNPESRTLSIGGICEDAMCGVASGISSFGQHIGVASSYAAFLAPLSHISGRLHGIGNQARCETSGGEGRPMILVCAHAGLKTGEDGPTHADPQALQLLQENFPKGTMITLTPWEPQEIWPLLTASLEAHPSVIAPFVTRPSETVPDRSALGLPPATAAAKGVYALRRANGAGDGTVVLQGSGVALNFVNEVMPQLTAAGVDMNVFYVASAELFLALPFDEQQAIFPEELTRNAMGITGFTLPTLYRWIRTDRGREFSLHPFAGERYLGSGRASDVLAEAGLGSESMFLGVRGFLDQVVHS